MRILRFVDSSMGFILKNHTPNFEFNAVKQTYIGTSLQRAQLKKLIIDIHVDMQKKRKCTKCFQQISRC